MSKALWEFNRSPYEGMLIRRTFRHLFMLIVTVLVGGLLGATLVRFAPGFGVDERELDARFSDQSIDLLNRERSAEDDVFRFYGLYLLGATQGDLGDSRSLGRPISELLAERVPVTFRSVSRGLVVGWCLGLGLALPTVLFSTSIYDFLSSSLSGLFLSLPSALLALLFLFVGWPAALAIGLVVFPRIFRYARNLLLAASDRPHILAARARGLGKCSVLVRHVLPVAGPEMLALAGVSVSMAFGAAVPIEVICDSPGIGQLAWEAALGRDLPLLVNLTVLVTAVTVIANASADLATQAWSPQRQ